MSDEQTVPDRPEFHSEFYELCEDPDCHIRAFRFNGGPTHHYHYIGPRQPVDEA